MPVFVTQPVPNDEAARLIRSKPALAREEFDRLLPELRSLAFTITGVQSFDVMQRVQDALAELPEGGDWEDIRERISQELEGILGKVPAESRAELLLRTHGFQVAARAQHAVAERHRDAFPYQMYLATADARTRSSHMALDKKVLPADSPFWHNHTPPWEWGCRCQVVVIDDEEAQEMRQADRGRAPEQRQVLEGSQLAELETGGRLLDQTGLPVSILTPRERGEEGGYEFRPYDLKLPLEVIEGRYDGQTLEAWRQWSATTPITGRDDGLTVREWMEGSRFAESRPEPEPEQAGPGRTLSAAERQAIQRVVASPKVRIGQSQSPTLDWPEEQRRGLDRFEREIRILTPERGAIHFPDGTSENFVGPVPGAGQDPSVSLPHRIEAHGAVFTHGHAGDTSFSRLDAERFFERGLAELRAAAPRGVFCLRPRAGAVTGRTAVANLRRDLTELERAVAMEVRGLAAADSEKPFWMSHLLMCLLAERGHFDYELRDYMPPRNQPGDLGFGFSSSEPQEDEGSVFIAPTQDNALAWWRASEQALDAGQPLPPRPWEQPPQSGA